jgi:hypothetical protein
LLLLLVTLAVGLLLVLAVVCLFMLAVAFHLDFVILNVKISY